MRAGIFLSCVALCLAGCSTAPVENPASPPATSGTGNAPAKPAPPPPPVPAPRPAPVTPPVKRPPALKAPSAATMQVTNLSHPPIQFNAPPTVLSRPVLMWTSLNNWAVQHDVTPPRRLTVSPVVTYVVGSQRGAMIVEIGSRDATWNGTMINLAFAPEMIDDQVFVHGLDLEKTFFPLLCEKPEAPTAHRVIVLDPGHGGDQPGAISVLPGRHPEKMFTLDVARRLAPLLTAEGWQVILTRTNDSDIAVSNRVTFAEAHHADLFISLHFNSYPPDPRQAGLETYCLTPTGMPSAITRGYPDLAWQSFPANAFDAQSLRLAVRLQKTILRATGEEDRGVRRARFLGILRGQHCPCVLIEGGYLSNPREAQKIENPEYRQKLAEAVAEAVK